MSLFCDLIVISLNFPLFDTDNFFKMSLMKDNTTYQYPNMITPDAFSLLLIFDPHLLRNIPVSILTDIEIVIFFII